MIEFFELFEVVAVQDGDHELEPGRFGLIQCGETFAEFFKDSGFGREGPRYAIHEMSELRTVTLAG